MPPSRDEIAQDYLAQLPYPPYPVQEEALLAWFLAERGVLVCAPTGTGKTLIALAALYEALRTGSVAYYTTPLIALTEQKFHEVQAAAVRWGFPADSVGLVTGHRRVNPQARVLVVVAEILLNRLLHQDRPEQVAGVPEVFDFTNVSAVVMDEFHSFADPERGIVWELSLSLLPPHVRLLLLSATVGNAFEFVTWLDRSHGRKVELVEGRDRKVPLTFKWVPDMLLGEQLVEMAKGDAETRKTPCLVFCFNRDQCWSVAENLKGLDLMPNWGPAKSRLHAEVGKLDWSQGVGPKLKQMLHRGVGVHHAGLLPKYRRVVEDLFEQKLLAVAVCTETLAAGINLPARSVLLTSLVKGPPGKEKLIDPSTAHQISGRAGRPQFDKEGFVYALAHEDDVKILRWKEKFDAIPENTKDPGLLRMKKDLKRKKPERRSNQQYWTEPMFDKLKGAPPGKLYSKGPLPWRLLAYLLKISPEVDRVRTVIRKRLMDGSRVAAGEVQLDRMLQTLARLGYVVLDPPFVLGPSSLVLGKNSEDPADQPPSPADGLQRTKDEGQGTPYKARLATPTEKLDLLLAFRSIHPLYGAFLLEHLGIADRDERLQALESVLEMPRPILRYARPPRPDETPPGPLATTRLDPELIQRGLIAAPLPPSEDEDDEEDDWRREEERPPSLAEKLFLLFEAQNPEVTDVSVQPVWAAGELLRFNGNFNLYVKAKDLTKQEGIVFRHCLRLILLCEEFLHVTPQGVSPEDWQAELRDIATRLAESCRAVDPASTDEAMQRAHEGDVVEGEAAPAPEIPPPSSAPQAVMEPASAFGEGLLDEEPPG
jgi:superfamily II DNA/RNA helicase